MMQSIASKIELFFLDYAISLLSESAWMRSLVKLCYQYKEVIRLCVALSVCGMIGLAVGRILVYVGISMPLH